MSPPRVLVVEDEPTMAEVTARYLRRDGHDVRVARDGQAALDALPDFEPQLVVLDLMLPHVDGLEVCRRIRARGDTPVIMVTARTDEVDRLIGFGLGADDYVTKPFSPRELAARVQAVLRRTGEQRASGGDGVIRVGTLRVDPTRRTVENALGPVDLTAREFDVLAYLARHVGQVFTRDQLLDAVWDVDAPTEPSAVTVHIRRIRAKLEEDPSRPRYLKTVWNVGYKLDA